MKNPVTRRRFIKSSALLAGGTFLISGTQASGTILGANDRVRVAVAGLNGRGKAHVGGWKSQENVEVAALVDPDSQVLGRAQQSTPDARCVADIRSVLDDKSIDAVSIAAPNHWHSLMTIWAAQAGKHVYVEKPMSHDLHEGRIVVAAQEKYGVVIQHGTQRRSNAGIAGLHEALQQRKLPRLKIAYGYSCKPRNGIGTKPQAKPPANLDWDLWQGPAVIDGYHANYVHYNWHWFWSTGNGELNNQGTHQLDVARWALDADQTHPTRVRSIGGRFKWQDQGETPNTMFAVAEYPNGQQVFFNVRNVNYDGYRSQVYNEYYLEDGSVITGEGNYKRRQPGGNTSDMKLEPGRVTPGGNWGSFISAVRDGDPGMANGDALEAHYACALGHMINISYRLGEPARFGDAVNFDGNEDAQLHFDKLHRIMADGVGLDADVVEYTVGPWLSFDPVHEQFVGELAGEANGMLSDPQRDSFALPGVESV